jgi:hypothetical protein
VSFGECTLFSLLLFFRKAKALKAKAAVCERGEKRRAGAGVETPSRAAELFFWPEARRWVGGT